jgi:hypothetical protein
MNRSVTIFLCAAVVWVVGLGEATDAGLQAQKRRQAEVSSGTRPAIPEIVGDYVLIYKPQPDVYSGKDTKHYKAGQRYVNWQPNDHTFIKESRIRVETANNLPEVKPDGAPQE